MSSIEQTLALKFIIVVDFLSVLVNVEIIVRYRRVMCNMSTGTFSCQSAEMREGREIGVKSNFEVFPIRCVVLVLCLYLSLLLRSPSDCSEPSKIIRVEKKNLSHETTSTYHTRFVRARANLETAQNEEWYSTNDRVRVNFRGPLALESTNYGTRTTVLIAIYSHHHHSTSRTCDNSTTATTMRYIQQEGSAICISYCWRYLRSREV